MAMSSTLFSIAPQVQAFGLGDITSAVTPAKASGSSVSAGDIDAFIKTAKEAETLIDTAANYIFKVVVSKEEVAKHEEAMKVANALTDPKEKEAKINQVEADRDTYLQKALVSKETEAKVKSMNKAQLTQFANASYTFMLGLLKDKQLGQASTSLVSGVTANPMLAPQLLSLKDSVSSVANQVQSAVKIGDGLIKLAKVGNLNIMPASTSEKPKAVSDI